MAHITIKQGDSIEWEIQLAEDSYDETVPGDPIPITGWTVRSQLRTIGGQVLIFEMPVAMTTPEEGITTHTATRTDTALWPPGEHALDVEYVQPDNFGYSTATVLIEVERDVTKPLV